MREHVIGEHSVDANSVDVVFSTDAAADAAFFTARLRPHRSLSRRGRGRTLAVIALLQASLGIQLGFSGAWPAAFFLGLTWLGLAFAFQRNARDALAREEISLSALELHYARFNPQGARRDWRFNPLWVRLRIERHPDFGVERLDFSAREKCVEIGACLGRNEKTHLAEELSAALARARQGARFSGGFDQRS
jgi:uncharacterized membrane protein